ncbi:peptidyl-tRNA hydrolase [Brevibacterium album]|uniref:peptidyl-tRNA hydrolase n=1 Tax=Brevibacterium album TaxID=417948 RepID=UPI001FE219B9|nr:peptidyl-tRNA hydrolase [Brevibacterium album]
MSGPAVLPAEDGPAEHRPEAPEADMREDPSEGLAETGPDVRRHERDHAVPWALPIVVRRSKAHPAREVDVCEAAAEVVVRLLDDPRSRPGGEWHEALEHWRAGAIRKVVRRGDGQQFADARALDCVGALVPAPGEDRGPAEALAFPPGPVRPLPRALKKLQVGGTAFPAEGESAVPAAEAVVTVELTPHHALTSGKAAAQCAHAAQLAYEQMPAAVRERWRAAGFRVRVERASAEAWAAGGRSVSITDAGFTELDGPTETTRARW